MSAVSGRLTKGYVRIADGQIHYRAVDGAGTPIIFLHRTPVASSSFNHMLGFLEGKHKAIALDTPGFGASFAPEGRPPTEAYGKWFLDAVEALGIDRFHLVAHHTGTHFAAEMARLAPARVLSLTLSGVLYAPAEERQTRRKSIGNAEPVTRDGAHVSNCWSLMKMLCPDYDADLVQQEFLGAMHAMEGRNQAFDAIYAQDFKSVFAAINCPVQVVQAADDPLTLSGMLTRFQQDFPEVPVDRIGSAFLAAPERQPGQFVRAVLAFISQLEGQHKDMTNRGYKLVKGSDGYDLARTEGPVPQPAHGEVVVRIHAVSINRRDIGVRDLSYPVNGADNFVPLSDGAGEIVAVGDGVTNWKVGDRVASTFFQNWPGGRLTLPAAVSSLGAGGPGVFADYVVLSAGGVTRIPDGWSFEEAASVPCAGVTAWRGLVSLGGLQKDDWVLVIGTGGVAIFALQIAVASGAKVIVLSSSDDKIERAKAMGAVAGVNYSKTPEWTDAVRAITGGMGVNHVIELGGSGTVAKSIGSLGLQGHMALIGALDGFGGDIPAMPMIFGGLRVSAVLVGPREDHEALLAFMTEKGLRPVIDSSYSFDDADNAYSRADKGAFGKVVITMGQA